MLSRHVSGDKAGIALWKGWPESRSGARQTLVQKHSRGDFRLLPRPTRQALRRQHRPRTPSPLLTPPSSMAQDQRPPLPSLTSQSSDTDSNTLTDPFADRQRAINFAEPRFPTPNQSVTSLPNEFGTFGEYDEEESEKLPLNAGGTGYP